MKVQASDKAGVKLRDGEVRVGRDGAILIVTLNRPQRLNALSGAMLAELGEIFESAKHDPSVRALIVTGAGRAFCSGADVSGLKNQAETPVAEQLKPMPAFTPRHCDLYKPTICAVNGLCASAGLHFVADCDIIIASETAQFTDTHTTVGQVSAIEPIGLARRMPLGAVLRMVILGKAERLDARRALELNMVSEVVPPDQLMERALELARLAASTSPAATQTSLQAIWSSFETPLAEAYRRGYELLIRHRDHPDAAEGPAAFLEKRQPVWR